MKAIRFLVPVDYSRSSLSALGYAIVLAKACGGSIDLLHITDADDIVESDNQIDVMQSLNKLEKKAADRIQSLEQEITQAGVRVSSKEAIIGNIKLTLLQVVKKGSPDLVVIGKGEDSIYHKSILWCLINETACPVIVVPESITLQIPSKVVLTGDMTTIAEGQLKSFFELMEHINQQFSVVTLHKNLTESPEAMNDKIRMLSEIHQQENKIIDESIRVFVSTHPVDVLCTPKHAHGSLWNFFHKNITKEMLQLDIPVYYVG